MFTRMCYVMFERPDGLEVPIIYPAVERHVDIGRLFKEWDWKVVSAGSIGINEDGTARCYAHSQGMQDAGIFEGSESRPEDSDIVNMMLGKL